MYQTPQSFGQSGEKEICHLEGDRHVPSPPSHQLLPYPVTPATSSCWEAGYRLPRFCCPSARRFLGVYSPHDSRSTCQKVSFPSSLSSYTSSAFHWCKHTFFFFFFALAVQNAQSYVPYVSYGSTHISGLVHWREGMNCRFLRHKRKVGAALRAEPSRTPIWGPSHTTTTLSLLLGSKGVTPGRRPWARPCSFFSEAQLQVSSEKRGRLNLLWLRAGQRSGVKERTEGCTIFPLKPVAKQAAAPPSPLNWSAGFIPASLSLTPLAGVILR